MVDKYLVLCWNKAEGLSFFAVNHSHQSLMKQGKKVMIFYAPFVDMIGKERKHPALLQTWLKYLSEEHHELDYVKFLSRVVIPPHSFLAHRSNQRINLS